ncbi:MAG: tyrosine/phenylalanine carboxypeptidase domain-containing protein, partial [Halofilum sp. (in: g-proteobacteria)]
GHAEQSFENTRRIFRGGRVEGGVPFTKDGVYLDGLLRVHNFMRTAVALGRADLLRLLFVGKLDIEDIPALAALRARGLCRAADHLPPWAEDPRFLISYLAYSSLLNTIDLSRLREHYAALADAAPEGVGA